MEPFKPDSDDRKKIILQYNLGGEEINRFSSASEASQSTGANKSSIAKVCRGERNHAGGYIWKYK